MKKTMKSSAPPFAKGGGTGKMQFVKGAAKSGPMPKAAPSMVPMNPQKGPKPKAK